MAGKQSAAMDEALRLVAGGMAIRAAARQAGVWWTSLHAAIKRQRDDRIKAKVKELGGWFDSAERKTQFPTPAASQAFEQWQAEQGKHMLARVAAHIKESNPIADAKERESRKFEKRSLRGK